MKQSIEAIFEHGVFRPLSPIPLAEQERVNLVVETQSDDLLDGDALAIAQREPEPEYSLAEIRQKLSRVPGSWGDDIIADRGEY